MVVQIRDSVIIIDAYESYIEHYSSPYSEVYTHTLENAEVEITSEGITIKGSEFFKHWLGQCKLKNSYCDYTEDDIEDRIFFKTQKPKGIFRFFKKKVNKSYKVPYLKSGSYIMKKRRKFDMVSDLRWVVRFSNVDVLSSESK